MNILHLSRYDSGGNGYFTSNAINVYTDHKSRAVRMEQTYLDYPFDVLGPDDRMLKHLIQNADVLHIRDAWDWLPNEIYDKPVIITFSGGSYRRKYNKLHHQCDEMGWLVTVSTLNLVLLKNSPWMPNPRQAITQPLYHNDTFSVCHTPTFRDRKGTATIEQALSGLDDVELVIVEGRPYADSLRERAKCHITIDQFRYGYGNSAIEAWSMGQPVLSYAKDSPAVVSLIRNKFSTLPWYNCPENVRYIKRWVMRLKNDTDLYRSWKRMGRRWFFKHHHSPVVAQRAIKLYEMVLGGKDGS